MIMECKCLYYKVIHYTYMDDSTHTYLNKRRNVCFGNYKGSVLHMLTSR